MIMFQEELLYNRLFQGMPGCLTSPGRDGKYSNLDKTITRGRPGGLGIL